ncbi:hypothetical protein AABB24_033013 [Solanum stoloniferum]|uniref:Ubiquitin-like domain-containing protein n=1 Tax=Solanum stoloniferum TaxID=62892 RepID=A0ABD2RLL5_9SOLN
MSQTAEEDKKPGGDQVHINLKVKSQVCPFSFLFIFMRILSPCLGFCLIILITFSVTLVVLDFEIQDGNEVFFRIKRSTQLKKLMNAYCDRQSVDFNSIAFLFDGRRLRGEQTPDELEMEDGDEIDAMLHQTGGSTV